jgi:hypothetical protein
MPFLKKLRPENANLRKILRSGLLMVSSAALGGIAVAVWNRRTLADIRREPDESDPGQPEVPPEV